MTKTLITSGDYLISTGGNLMISSPVVMSNTVVISSNLSIGGANIYAPVYVTSGNGNLSINLINSESFLISLSGNARLITTNPIDGRTYTFMVAQPIGGNCNFSWPNNFIGAGNINIGQYNVAGNSICVQEFLYVNVISTFIPKTEMLYIGLGSTA